jgi:hypothetical protein
MLDIGARLTMGRPMPFEDKPVPSSSVLFLTGEDGIADTIRPRFDAAGGDPHRLIILELGNRNSGVWRDPVLPQDADTLYHVIRDYDVRLTVIDPLKAFLACSVDDYRDQHLRTALKPLAQLAEETDSVIEGVRHWTKATTARAIDRGAGSVAYGAAARVVLTAAPDPNDEQRYVLASVKNNLSDPAPSLSYHIEGTLVGSGIYTSRIVWDGRSEHTAEALNAAPVDQEERSALDEAKDFLEATLHSEPRKVYEITKQARREGIADRTLRRAAKEMGVEKQRIGFGPGSYVEWSIADKCSSLGQHGQYEEPNPISTEESCGSDTGQVPDHYAAAWDHSGQHSHTGPLAEEAGDGRYDDDDDARIERAAIQEDGP